MPHAEPATHHLASKADAEVRTRGKRNKEKAEANERDLAAGKAKVREARDGVAGTTNLKTSRAHAIVRVALSARAARVASAMGSMRT